MEPNGVVLIADDDAQSCRLAADVLESAGFDVILARDGAECLELAQARHPDVIVLDRVMPGVGGDEVAKTLRASADLRDIKIILLSAKDKPRDKITGLDRGADDYLTKPYDRGELIARVNVHLRTKRAEDALQQAYTHVERKVAERTAELAHANTALQSEVAERKRAEVALRKALAEVEQLKNRLQAENRYLQDEISSELRLDDMLGESEALRQVLHQVRQVAPTDATVLITGESGTGKELIARALHRHSRRAERPLVKVNCAALPANLVESELFGHEKGAFTGAVAQKIGRFELANGGTLFLDEIGDLPLELQAKLLRALQEGEFERLGSNRTLHVDVRVIAATNRDLHAAMGEGQFREDLFYRLNVFPIVNPPLRERREDIALLARHFMSDAATRVGKRLTAIPTPVMAALQSYGWPGNVRELKNVIERAVILSPGPELEWAQAPEADGLTTGAAGGGRTLRDAEERAIRDALDACGWVIEGGKGAAAALGLPSSTLRSRMRKLDIRKPAER